MNINITQKLIKNKNKRKPRRAQGKRNFACGCGKAYLSYPALYTHVKNKHEGEFPIGSNSKRKLPKELIPDLSNYFRRDLESFNLDLEYMFKRIQNSKNENTKREMTKNDIIEIFSNLDKTKNSNIAKFQKAMDEMIHLQNDDEKFKKFSESLNIFQVLSYYLIQIFPKCQKQFFFEYFLLIFMLTNGLEKEGSLFLEDFKKNEKTDKNFCEENYVEIIPEIFNIFIAELFPNYYKEINNVFEINFRFLGCEKEDNIKNLVLMIQFLGFWLFCYKFTKFKPEISFDF